MIKSNREKERKKNSQRKLKSNKQNKWKASQNNPSLKYSPAMLKPK